MAIISESQLKNFRNSTRTFSATITDSLNEYKSESKYSKTKIFLSHKHNELESLDAAVSLLKKEGANIYIDWLDEGMPKTTSGETATRIKEKIKENDKFILLATEAAIDSKWCNWELGLGDAAKYISNIALLPVKKDNINFSGSEYLQIYPYIEYENGLGRYSNGSYIPSGYYVRFPAVNGLSNMVRLSEWLTR